MPTPPAIPRLICVTGLPGTGKSYYSIRLASAICGRHLNSDRLRSRLGLRGKYDPASKKMVYDELFREARETLADGKTVVLDSTFYKRDIRLQIETLAREVGVPVMWIEIRAPEAIIRERIGKQRPYSQANFEVYEQIRDNYEPLKDPDLIIDSHSESAEDQIERTKAALGMMTSAAIRKLMEHRAFPDSGDNTSLVETHASWVVLSDNYAFKIKKPVQFSFMDFSTLERRKYFCQRELELNRRLTRDIYLDVLPVFNSPDGPVIGKETGPLIDYSVQLKRLEESKRMEHLLENGEVQTEDIRRIARKLAAFHQDAEVIRPAWNLDQAVMDFYDLKKIRPMLATHMSRREAEILDRILLRANQFLKQHAPRFRSRIESGFVRDGHGDLHSGNIFLYPDPILFDCIEFNDHFRQLDLLDELAFLSMDLEYYNQVELAAEFLRTYRSEFEVIQSEEDLGLFRYYKLYRANVRLKVTALKDLDHPLPEDLDKMRKYLQLMADYAEGI